MSAMRLPTVQRSTAYSTVINAAYQTNYLLFIKHAYRTCIEAAQEDTSKHEILRDLTYWHGKLILYDRESQEELEEALEMWHRNVNLVGFIWNWPLHISSRPTRREYIRPSLIST